MTPPASAAARSTHRNAPTVRRAPVRHPRRISGPARPTALSAAAVALPAPARLRPSSLRQAPGVALRAIGMLDRASRGALLERLIRGRGWIGVLAFALIGIVAMQLLVLKLNNEIGHTLQRQVALERQNAQLGIEGSEASAGSLVEPRAAAAGMTLAAPSTLHFVAIAPSDIRRAAAVLSSPIQAPAAETPGG